MKLTRDQFCKLTIMKPDRLKSLVRRNQLPRPSKMEDVPEGKHNYYTPIQALKMVLVDDMIADGGITIQSAVRDVNSFEDQLAKCSSHLNTREADKQIYLVSFYFHLYGSGERPACNYFHGTLKYISEYITRQSADRLREGHELGRILLVNASDAYRRMENRARENQIDLTWKWKRSVPLKK